MSSGEDVHVDWNRFHLFNCYCTQCQNITQDPPVEHNLYLSLEDIMKRCTKRIVVLRKVMQPDGTMYLENKELTIVVEPGSTDGTKITFLREGNQSCNKIPADIVFVVRDIPHPHFRRVGSVLHYTAQISLKQALCGCVIEVPTLNPDELPIKILFDDVIKPNTVKRIRGKRLPLPLQPSRRGDLILSFDIKFPNQLSQFVKCTLDNIIPN